MWSFSILKNVRDHSVRGYSQEISMFSLLKTISDHQKGPTEIRTRDLLITSEAL